MAQKIFKVDGTPGRTVNSMQMQMQMSLAKLQIQCAFTKIYSFNSLPNYKGGTNRRPLVCWINILMKIVMTLIYGRSSSAHTVTLVFNFMF